MKRVFAAILVLAMVVSLCGCKSEEARNAEKLIAAIGNVTADSEAALTAAEAAYSALTQEDKDSIKNHDVLVAARNSYDVLSVTNLIAAIGDVTLDSEAALAAAEAAYGALSEENKAGVNNRDVLTAARDSYDVLCVTQLIDAIGEVTLESEAAIAEAEAAFAALSDGCKAQVSNAAALEAALADYETAVYAEEVRLSLIGTWVNEAKGDFVYRLILEDTNCHATLCAVYDADGNVIRERASVIFELLEDGSFTVDGDCFGKWELSKDASTVTFTPTLEGAASETSVLSVIDEGGFTKLVGSLLNSPAFGYVRSDEYEAAFAEKFVVAKLNIDNVHDYIGEPVSLGKATDPDGKERNCHIFPSQAYDDGLVYLGCSCYIECVGTHNGQTITIDNGFPVIGGWSQNIATTGIGRVASGEMYYIKAEYVAENYIDEEGYRTLVLTNGVKLRFEGYAHYLDVFWSYVNANYEDYIY